MIGIRETLLSLSGKYLARHMVDLPPGAGGKFSVTFDDFPLSAVENGGEILKKYGIHGTYFLDCELCGQDSPVGRISSFPEVRSLIEDGHEIGSHTYSHLRPFRQPIEQYKEDLKKNQETLNQKIGQDGLVSFSYPYGETTGAIKNVTAQAYRLCRSIYPGINGTRFDRAALRANKLYHDSFDRENILKLIRITAETSGWVIFYTHDVEEHCSPYGCTPGELEFVIEEALGAGLEGCSLREMNDLITTSPKGRV